MAEREWTLTAAERRASEEFAAPFRREEMMADRLAEIEALLSRATPGPWRVGEDGYGDAVVWREGWSTRVIDGGEPVRDADAQLIAEAPGALRDLLAVAKAAKPVLREWLPHSGMCVAQEYGPGGELLPPRCRCAPEAQALRAALANLEGGA